MAHTDFPYLEGDDEKDNANQGRTPLQDDGKSQGVVAFENCQCWQVIYTREGYDVSKKFAKPDAVDGQGVLCGLHTTVGHGIHEFERFGGPKRNGGLYDQEADEEASASKYGGEDEIDFWYRPGDVEGVACPGEDCEALEQAADAAEGEFIACELQGGAAGAKQEAVEVAAFDHGAEYVEAARGSVCKGEGDVDEAVEKGHFGEGPALDVFESREEGGDGEKFDAGGEEVSKGEHDK